MCVQVRKSLLVSHIMHIGYESPTDFKRLLCDKDNETELPFVGVVVSSVEQLQKHRLIQRLHLPETICVICPSGTKQ